MPEVAGRVAESFGERMRRNEELALSRFAVQSYETRGRLLAEEECTIRTPFQWPVPPAIPVTLGVIPVAMLLMRDGVSVLVRESLTQSAIPAVPDG